MGENKWKFAQFLFPLMATTSVGMAHTNNFLAIPLTVLSLYKFGFPETILFLYSSLYDKRLDKGMRLKDFLNGVGTLIHHSSSALYIAMILIKVYPSSRTSIEVVVPVLIQHWFVLLNYNFSTLYIVVETILEGK